MYFFLQQPQPRILKLREKKERAKLECEKKIETISIGNYFIRFYTYSLIEEQQKYALSSSLLFCIEEILVRTA